MSKSARIVTLTVTTVLTVAVFAMLWMVRPSEDNQVLQAARERQAESLITVSEPLETDIATLSEQEKFANEVQAVLLNDATFRRELEAIILSDEEFISRVKDAIMPSVDERVETLVKSYADEYKSEIVALVESESLKYSDTTRLVDELIDPVTTRIYNDFAANDEYIDQIAAVVKERIEAEGLTPLSEDQIEEYVIDIYNKYSEDIISDIVNRVLAELDKSAAATPSTTSEESAPVPSAPVFETTKSRAVNAPDFTTVKAVPENDYAAVRASEREKAIKAVLDALSD